MALSLHAAAEVTEGDGVNGSSVGVPVGGTAVGRVKPCFVGGRVEVTKRGGASGGVSSATVTQEVRMKMVRRVMVQIFFMGRFYLIRIVPQIGSDLKFKPATCGTVFMQ
jgi:hypothetical protein